MDPQTIIIADNQYLIHEAVLSILLKSEFELTLESVYFKSELIERVTILKPAVVIVDPDTMDFDSADDLRLIKKYSPQTEIFILSANQDNNDVAAILDAGANQYILKTTDDKEFSDALRAAISHKKYLCSEILDIVLNKKPAQEPARITTSEIEIVRLIAQGLTAKEIATKKFISVHTVNTHRKNIFRKLNVNSTSELIMHAIRSGIVDTTEYYI